MPRRWWVVMSVVLFLGLVAGWNLYLAVERPRWAINRQQFERIEIGMTRKEVITLIGRPPGDYTIARYPWKNLRQGGGLALHYFGSPAIVEEWYSDAGCIEIGFVSGRVDKRRFDDFEGGPLRDWSDILQRLVVPGP